MEQAGGSKSVGKGRRGRPPGQGKRTASGRISRAGTKPVKGSLGTRLLHARPLLADDDRIRLEVLVTHSAAALLDAGQVKVGKSLAGAEALAAAEEKVELEREALFAKAEHAENAIQRRDPIGRAWHEGLLDGHGVDPAALRDIGRQFGFLYWHEYREVDATVGGYSDMVALGSVRLATAGRDALGYLWKVYSDIIEGMGREVREALDRLCVNDMWFAGGPDWLDRVISTARVGRTSIAGTLARKDDLETMRRAISGLVALARGGADKLRVELDGIHLATEAGRASVAEAQVASLPPIDPRFIDKRGHMRSWDQVREIILGADPEEIDAREDKAA